MADRSDLSNGQASKPYSKIGIHFVFINGKVISSEAICPTLPNIALAEPDLYGYCALHP